ncbi:MAG: hypothetical protein INR70_24055 [Parafilimonas terrae]|jgi:hypothetical protein|nr:hypothetical protein [Parafilimonas terrae]
MGVGAQQIEAPVGRSSPMVPLREASPDPGSVDSSDRFPLLLLALCLLAEATFPLVCLSCL